MMSSFNTAIASIRKTDLPFHYQLVITRAYQEGEIELMDEDELDENDAEERTFLLDEVLKPRNGSFEGNNTIEWRDLEEDDTTGGSSEE
ncbi:2547_t:CDS:2, partial [Acaulospora colombiana]